MHTFPDPVWHPYTPEPHLGPRAFFTSAQGAFVYDDKGRRYFDGTSSWWCITHGHCHPRLTAALERQARTLDQVMLAPHSHGPAEKLAHALLEKTGPGFGKVFYSDDGSTAVEAGLKIALQYWRNRGLPGRRKILTMELAYHGDTLGTIALSNVDAFHEAFSGGVGLDVERSAGPYCYRCPLKLDYPSCSVACLDPARKLIAERGDGIAALLVEPLVLGAAGMIVYPKAYLEELVRLAKAKGILVLFDEVFTGFGRAGSFFAYEQLAPDCRPDVVCLSKGLTAGMLPLGATVVRADLFDAFRGGGGKTFFHGHTFTGNPLGCAVALESLKLFDEEGTLERNRALSRVMEEGGEALADLPHVGQVRQQGMIWAVELVRDRQGREVFKTPNGPGWRIAQSLWDQGIWLRPLHNMLYVIPPYCSPESDLRRLFDLLYSELLVESHFEE